MASTWESRRQGPELTEGLPQNSRSYAGSPRIPHLGKLWGLWAELGSFPSLWKFPSSTQMRCIANIRRLGDL